jgi:hypothetical protein
MLNVDLIFSMLIVNSSEDESDTKRQMLSNQTIPSSDLRRLYPKMFFNMYNSGDVALMQDFCRTYFDPNVVFSNVGGGWFPFQFNILCVY